MKTKANNEQNVTIKITVRKMSFYVACNNKSKKNGKFLKKFLNILLALFFQTNSEELFTNIINRNTYWILKFPSEITELKVE